MRFKTLGSLAALLLMGVLAMPVLAQNNGGGGGNGGGGFGGGGQGGGGFGGGGGGGFGGQGGQGGGRGNFDPAQMQQMRLQALQQQLGLSDEDFAALTPKIQKVMQLQQDANPRGGRGGRGGGGPGGPGGQGGPGGGGFNGPPNNGQPQSDVQKARAEVQAALDDPNSTPDLIKGKLDAYRAAVAKAKDDYAAAQADLKQLLTQRQEAVMVMAGYLN